MADDNTDKARDKKADSSNSNDDENKPDTSKQGDNKEGDSKDKQQEKDDQPTGKTFSQDDVNKIIQKRLKEEKDRAKAEKETEDAKAKGEFEKLAGKFEAEAKDTQAKYEALTVQHDELKEATNSLIATLSKALPESIRELKPETDNPVELLKWLAKAQKIAGKLGKSDDQNNQNGDKKTGNPGIPKPAAKGDKQAADNEDTKAELKRRQNYGSSF